MRTIVIIVMLLLAGSGCAAYQRCAQKYGGMTAADTIFSVRERVVSVEVPMPADTIETIIDCGRENGRYAAYSRDGYLKTEVTPQETLVRVRTTIVPQYIRDTLRLVDSVMVVREKMVLAKKDEGWKYAAFSLLAIIILTTIGIFFITKTKR